MENLIYKKIPLVMGEIGAVEKGGYNAHQKYKFRGIEQFYAAAHPVMVKHGVFCVPQVIELKTETYTDDKTKFRVLLTVQHKFYAEDGSHVSVVTVGEGIDTSDKATNKAMSAAMKYAFIELFSIPTQDVADSDHDTPEVKSVSSTKLDESDVPLDLGASKVKPRSVNTKGKVSNANEL